MKVLITGATGFVGRHLVKKLIENKHEVWALTRSLEKAEGVFPENVKFILWDNYHLPPDLGAMAGLDAVINLMGENIGAIRWTNQVKKEIYNSRVDGTRNLIKGLVQFKLKPSVFISTSAIGFYGTRPSENLTEESQKSLDEEFLTKVCSDWEDVVTSHKKYFDRYAILRAGLVLGPGAHAVERLRTIFRWGVGGILGDGNQYMSWIHLEDLSRMYLRILENSTLTGIFNAVSEFPVTNREFGHTLATILRRPLLFNIPGFALKTVLGEMSTTVLQDAKVKPERFRQLRFHYRYPTIEHALKDALALKDG